MAKKNKRKRKQDINVVEFLLKKQREQNRVGQLAVEILGKGAAYLVDTLLVPLLQAQTTTDRMRAETERFEVEQRLKESRKSLKDHRRSLKIQQQADRRQEERLDEQLQEVPNSGQTRG